MLLSVGTKVELIYSNEKAVVIALLEERMIKVRLLDSGMEIPVFEGDIRRLESTFSRTKAKMAPGKRPKVKSPPVRKSTEGQGIIVKNEGVQLAFAPIMNLEAITEKYEIFLLNLTKSAILFTFKLELGGEVVIDENTKLDAMSTHQLGDLWFDELNDSPVCRLEIWQITTEGTGPRMEKNLRIKPKQFFKKELISTILNRSAHVYPIFEKLTSRKDAKPKEEDLKSYTKRQGAPASSWLNIGNRMPHEVKEFAEFIPEIDLHINKLVSEPKKLNKAAILRIQLDCFDRYLDKAIRLGVERVFIIHGVGEGRLKNHIASRLLQTPEVVTFKNEYHPRYGYGATEVIF